MRKKRGPVDFFMKINPCSPGLPPYNYEKEKQKGEKDGIVNKRFYL
jgi:hypothetical protein